MKEKLWNSFLEKLYSLFYNNIVCGALFLKGGLGVHEEFSVIWPAVVTHIRDHLQIKSILFWNHTYNEAKGESQQIWEKRKRGHISERLWITASQL